MIPIVSDVYRLARKKLGDEQNQTFHNWVLEDHYATAYRDLFRILDVYGNTKTERSAHYNLPANMVFLDPITFGVANFGEPIDIGSRSVDKSFAVTAALASPSADPPNVLLTLDAAHGLAEGDDVVVYGIKGISDDVNDQWTISLSGTTASQIKLLGSTAFGSYTNGGVASTSKAQFGQKWEHRDGPFNLHTEASTNVRLFSWTGDRFRFPKVAETRQLRIRYSLSGEPPLKPSASIGIDDSLDFLGYWAAALAGPTKGLDQRARALAYIAVGPSGVADGSGGILKQMITLGIHTLQQKVIQTKRFLPRLTGGVRRRYTTSFW